MHSFTSNYEYCHFEKLQAKNSPKDAGLKQGAKCPHRSRCLGLVDYAICNSPSFVPFKDPSALYLCLYNHIERTMLTFWCARTYPVLLSMRLYDSSHIASFQLGSRRHGKRLGIEGEDEVEVDVASEAEEEDEDDADEGVFWTLTCCCSKMRLVVIAGPLFLLANDAYTWNGKEWQGGVWKLEYVLDKQVKQLIAIVPCEEWSPTLNSLSSKTSCTWAVLVVRVGSLTLNPSPPFGLLFISPLKGFSGLSVCARERVIGAG
ncbi:hypothetical protein Tco_0586295, partial [Tanacetum coccineum]